MALPNKDQDLQQAFCEDDDFDFAIAAFLQSHDEGQAITKSPVSQVCSEDEELIKLFNADNYDDFDFAIASSLQSQYEREAGTKSSVKEINPKDEMFLRKLDEDLDYALALSLQSAFEIEEDEMQKSSKCATNTGSKKLVASTSKPLSIVDKQWEMIDPSPDIYALFQEYDKRFFYGALKSVAVSWSKRMTLCAGVCSYEGRGGFCSIRLSMPLLKLRPRRDLVETLLHEMIHAYLFVTHNNKDRSGHGPEFLKHMYRINKESGTNITVYHTFHDEVSHYKQHIWLCDGPCRHRYPFYGKVARAMNRAPGPNDTWWADHQKSCGGKFVKIKEPDNYKSKGKSDNINNKKAVKRKSGSASSGSCSDIRSFIKDDVQRKSANKGIYSKPPIPCSSNISTLSSFSKENSAISINSAEKFLKKNFVPFQGTGRKLGDIPSKKFDAFPHKLLQSSTPSTSSGKTENSVYSIPHKYPKFSSSGNAENVFGGSLPSSNTVSSESPKKLIQIPMDKFLSPKKASDSRDHSDKSSLQMDLTVTCPLCFLKFKKEEINSHVDKCLLVH